MSIIIIFAIINKKTITIVINSKPQEYITFKSDVRKLLKNKNISLEPKDKIFPSLDAKIYDKDTITIKRAVNVSVYMDGKKLSIQSAEDNVESFIKSEGLSVNKIDKVEPSINTLLSDGMEINIIRVEIKSFTESIPIDFKTIINKNSGLPNNHTKVTQEGILGEKQIITNVTYENGKEVCRNIVSENISKKPVDKTIVQGTYPLLPISRGGDILPYSKIIKSKTTAYYAVHGVGSTFTSTGRIAVRNPDGYSTVAVDPSVISYGSKLFIEGYGFAIAADTGSAICGNWIDVYFNTYSEACNWAVKYVNVYILK